MRETVLVPVPRGLPLAFLLWFSLVFLAAFAAEHGALNAQGTPVPASAAAAAALVEAWMASVTAAVALLLARRHRIGRDGWLASGLRHTAAATLLGLAGFGLHRGMVLWLDLAPTSELSVRMVGSFLVYFLLGGVAHAAEYVRQVGQKEIAELRLRTELAETELRRAQAVLRRVLTRELSPHFLLRSLGAVSSLLRKDVAAADRLLVQLSLVLRQGLSGLGRQEVVLEEELEALKPFLEMERSGWARPSR